MVTGLPFFVDAVFFCYFFFLIAPRNSVSDLCPHYICLQCSFNPHPTTSPPTPFKLNRPYLNLTLNTSSRKPSWTPRLRWIFLLQTLIIQALSFTRRSLLQIKLNSYCVMVGLLSVCLFYTLISTRTTTMCLVSKGLAFNRFLIYGLLNE